MELTKTKEHLKMAEEDIRRLEDENAVSSIGFLFSTYILHVHSVAVFLSKLLCHDFKKISAKYKWILTPYPLECLLIQDIYTNTITA